MSPGRAERPARSSVAASSVDGSSGGGMPRARACISVLRMSVVRADVREMSPAAAVYALHRQAPMCDSAVIAYLEEKTREHHADADADRLGLLSPSVVRTDYLAYLAKVYAFEAPIETALTRTPRLESVISLKPRLGQVLLAQDLLALGLRLPKLDRMPRATTPFASPGEALGWIYVIERGRRLHGTIRRHLAMTMSHELRAAGSYLEAHEKRAFANWRELGQVLDRFAGGSGIVQQVLAGARDAYLSQRSAFIADETKAA